jgi:glycogen synthase
MRLLFLSNYYPPHSRGGYEQWCHEVALELTRRGHHVRVVTSRVPDTRESNVLEGVEVDRVLNLEVVAGLADTLRRLRSERAYLEQENLEQLKKIVADFKPDVSLIWGMWNVPRSVPTLLEELMAAHVAYYLCDYWPSLPSAYVSQLQNPSDRRLTRLPKRLVGKPFLIRLGKEPRIPLRFAHPICVSRAVRELLIQAGVAMAHADIIYGGVRPDEFAAAALARSSKVRRGLKLLYAGRLEADKGAHTAIRSLARIRQRDDHTVTLDVVGKGAGVYERELQSLVERLHLSSRVSFKGTVGRADMPEVFAHYDALVFPSEWDEPFARTVLEAMASGLVVIGTTTGGTGEVLAEGETGLTFPRGDANALAKQIERLRDDAALRTRLAERGRQRVREHFTLKQMVDRLEAKLLRI